MAEKKYQQIYESIRNQILYGEVKPGDILPSENELAAKFHASRVTVRKSLSILESQHIIYSHHGKGYFVNAPEHQRYTLIYDDHIQKMDCTIRSIMLEKPTEELQKALNRDKNDWIVAILRTLQKKQLGGLVCDQVYIPYQKGMPLVEEEIQYAEFPYLAKNKFSEFMLSTKMEIGHEAVDKKIAELLGIETGTHVLVVYRYLMDESDQVAVYGKQYLHPTCGRIVAYSGAVSDL